MSIPPWSVPRSTRARVPPVMARKGEGQKVLEQIGSYVISSAGDTLLPRPRTAPLRIGDALSRTRTLTRTRTAARPAPCRCTSTHHRSCQPSAPAHFDWKTERSCLVTSGHTRSYSIPSIQTCASSSRLCIQMFGLWGHLRPHLGVVVVLLTLRV